MDSQSATPALPILEPDKGSYLTRICESLEQSDNEGMVFLSHFRMVGAVSNDTEAGIQFRKFPPALLSLPFLFWPVVLLRMHLLIRFPSM